MKLKKKYKFDNGRQIWRIIPTSAGKLIIEERESETKQAYFHCVQLDSGKTVFSGLQPIDNFWCGIEAIKDDIIFYHKFAKPDMPKHRGVFAFDINSQKIIWENPELTFQFLFNNNLYAFKEKFEGKYFYAIDPYSGSINEEFGMDFKMINELRERALTETNNEEYSFPEVFYDELSADDRTVSFINSLKEELVISGKIEFLVKNELLMMSFHAVNSKGSLNNLFKAVDLNKGKYILEEVINRETKLYFTDSFFVMDDLLFLLFGKTRLEVYKIIN